jgi:hypothetical protein
MTPYLKFFLFTKQFCNFDTLYHVMFRLIIPQIKKTVFVTLIVLTGIVSLCFVVDEQDMVTWTNKCFAQSYDTSTGDKLKKFELLLTNDAFIRLRKTYTNNKQEYFSFHLHRLNDMSYMGDAVSGTLQFKTTDDDIIVQTYNDRKGNVDSMASVLNIPVKNMGAERLDSLHTAIEYFKTKKGL